MKATSLRLDCDLSDELAIVARADEMTVSAAMREAIEKHIAERRADADFQVRLKERSEANQRAIERLLI